MVESYRRAGPLTPLGLEARAGAERVENPGVALGERPVRDRLVLRGDADSSRLRKATARLAVELPTEPNTVSTGEGALALWLGPDEWLIAVDAGAGVALEQSFEHELHEEHFALSDVSHSRVVLRLSGASARDVLAKGCPLDFHPRAFSAGRCAQSTMAKAHVLIHQVDDSPTFDIYVHRSFANYAWDWLEDAAGEFGLEIVGAA